MNGQKEEEKQGQKEEEKQSAGGGFWDAAAWVAGQGANAAGAAMTQVKNATGLGGSDDPTEWCGYSILNDTNCVITCYLSQQAILKYENDILPGEIWYRDMAAHPNQIYAMLQTHKSFMTEKRANTSQFVEGAQLAAQAAAVVGTAGTAGTGAVVAKKAMQHGARQAILEFLKEWAKQYMKAQIKRLIKEQVTRIVMEGLVDAGVDKDNLDSMIGLSAWVKLDPKLSLKENMVASAKHALAKKANEIKDQNMPYVKEQAIKVAKEGEAEIHKALANDPEEEALMDGLLKDAEFETFVANCNGAENCGQHYILTGGPKREKDGQLVFKPFELNRAPNWEHMFKNGILTTYSKECFYTGGAATKESQEAVFQCTEGCLLNQRKEQGDPYPAEELIHMKVTEENCDGVSLADVFNI